MLRVPLETKCSNSNHASAYPYSDLFHHLQEVLLAQFSLFVHKQTTPFIHRDTIILNLTYHAYVYKNDWRWNKLISICPTYAVYREIMYDKITLNCPNFTFLENENTFMHVMSSNDKCVLDFVDIALSKRMAFLYNCLFVLYFICLGPLMFVTSVNKCSLV